jgi:hypothetical protein
MRPDAGAMTVKPKVVVWTTAPLVPVTVTVKVPTGVAAVVVSVNITAHVGVHEGAEKLAVIPAGSPDAL